MELKKYQQKTLDALKKFLNDAKLIGCAEAFHKHRDAPSYPREYLPLPSLDDAPYICLRLPTGGGKTLLGACSIRVAATALGKDYPLVLWLVPSDVIRQQTLKLLRDVRTYYRQELNEAFKGRVNIFDVTEFRQLRPQDLDSSLNIFVATFQSFRVEDRDGRKVYQSNEFLEPCFRNISRQDYFKDDATGGWKSFGNLIAYLRPLIIVDEAHNNSTKLSLKVMQDLRPSAVIEFTATPDENNSNILYQVSAQELKAEAMIKLPIMLRESLSWEAAIDEAVQKRTALETLANHEAEYIRPIVLFQAENRNGEANVDAVKKYLIDGAKVPENQIAIATGNRRELDGTNLSARDCPIRYVITVQALKEGWDCPFAYVFCSLAKVHSSTAAEQFLGRVLRMPNVKLRESLELNKAYAFAVVNEWHKAAAKLRDNLVDMGFEKEEAKYAIQQTLIYKDEDNRNKSLSALYDENFAPAQDKSPSARGVKFEIPMLCLDFGDRIEVAERLAFLPTKWRLTGKYDTALPNFRRDVEAQVYEFDVAGHKVTEKYIGDGAANLFHGETNWTDDELIGWFADKILSTDLNFEDLTEFIRRILNRLSDEQNIALDEFVRLRFSLLKVLTEKISDCRVEAIKKGWQENLFGAESVACVKPEVAKIFDAEYYPAKSFYRGHVQFEKHFYPLIDNMNPEEIRCAQLIDTNENVATWIRNVDSEPVYSFWLPTHKGRFYPDFVVKLTNGTYAAVEYKSEDRKTNEDSREKKLVGELWQKHQGGKFLMATLRDDKGRNLETQIRECFQ